MALIRCPECGKERVSDTASNCPECGFNIMEYFQRKKDKENIDDKKIYVDDNSIIDFKNEFIYKKKSKSKPAIGICIFLGIIIVLISSVMLGLKLNNKGSSGDIIANSENQEIITESTEETKKFTKKQLTEAIKDYIDNNRSETFVYAIDEYDDSMTIMFADDMFGSYIASDKSCYIICYPYMKVIESEGEGKLIAALDVNYGSSNFLDYYVGNVPFVVLASDGTRYTFNLNNYDTENNDNIYSTYFYTIFNYNDENNELTDENINEIKSIFEKDGLTFKLNKENIENYCLSGDLDPIISSCNLVDSSKVD